MKFTQFVRLFSRVQAAVPGQTTIRFVTTESEVKELRILAAEFDVAKNLWTVILT